MLIMPYQNDKLNTYYGNENHKFREIKTRNSFFYNNPFKIKTDISINNIKNKNKSLKSFQNKNNNNENSNTQRSISLTKKPEIKFPLKGKVPKLLINNEKTINKVLDKLISKEKHLCSNLNTENRKSSNNENTTRDNNKTHRKFISHLELLGFDNLVNEIDLNHRKSYLNNKIENNKNMEKIKLMPIQKLTNQKFYFN